MAVALAILASGASAQPAPTKAPAHELTTADLEAFLDGLLPSQLAREDIAGAVVSVVKDGKLIFAKGYGFSDVDKRTPVTPDATLFRPGSISKLFTWTSVMQLSEQGKLDLDRDVNEYLDFKIPAAWGKPITLKNIMTHSAGFEEVGRDLFVPDAQHMHSLDRFLKEYIPQRIFPPGTVPAYSNYATALAGYIVQRVSGKPFSQYVEDNILTPLGLQKTTFIQPLPDNLKPLMSSGYDKASQKAKPFEFVEAYPAGSVSTTAADMARFMIAHLQNGELEGRRILKPETAKLMHSSLFTTDARLNAMDYGFYEETRNGKRIIGHGGDTVVFHSDLHLILEENVGLFVSYNSAGKGEISPRSLLFHQFLDRYYPYAPPLASKLSTAVDDGKAVAGFYKNSRRFDTSFASLATLLEEATVTPNPDGTISVDLAKLPNGEVKKFEEIGPMLFREVNGQDVLGFKKDADGNWEARIDFPFFVFQKVGLLENKNLNLALLIFGLTVALFTVLAWPVTALIRKFYGIRREEISGDRKWRLLLRLLCLLFIGFSLAWVAVASMAEDITQMSSLPPWIVSLSILGHILLIGTLLACWRAFQTLRKSGFTIWARLYSVALALGCVSLIWFALKWNLMNFRTHF